MLLLDAVIVLCIFFFIIYGIIPIIISIFSKNIPLEGDLKNLESEIDQAVETKQKSDNIIAITKKKAESTLDKIKELNKKIS